MTHPPQRVIFGIDANALSGVDTLHCALASALAQRGFAVTLLLFGRKAEAHLPDCPNCECIDIKGPPKWKRITRPRKRYWTPFFREVMQRQAHTAIRERLPATLIAGHLGGLWMPPTQGLVQLGVIHAADPGNRQSLLQHHEKWDACVAVSQEAYDMVAEHCPTLIDRSTVILNGVAQPKNLAQRQAGPLRVLLAGRIEQTQKRVLDLPPILAQLKQLDELEFIIAGDGEALASLQAGVQSAAPKAQVRFLGKQSHASLLQQMEEIDAFLLLSAYEGTPMALLEAMARGCIPVTSTGCGGALPLIESSFLEHIFAPGDTAHAARILDKLAETPLADRQALQRKAYATLKDSPHTIDVMIQAYIDLIAKASGSPSTH